MLDAISNIDTEKSGCFNPLDKEMIDKAINESVGYHTLNDIILGELREWLVATSVSEFQRLVPEGVHGKFDDLDNEQQLRLCMLASCIGKLNHELGKQSWTRNWTSIKFFQGTTKRL